jgi:hypothetical protein
MAGQESRHWPPLGRGHSIVIAKEDLDSVIMLLRDLADTLEDLSHFAHAVELQRGKREHWFVPSVTVVR